jgi:hypothetical protein
MDRHGHSYLGGLVAVADRGVTLIGIILGPPNAESALRGL